MDKKFSEREELLRKSVSECAENELTPKMEAMEGSGEFSTELLRPMAELGVHWCWNFRVNAPCSRHESSKTYNLNKQKPRCRDL